MTELKTIVLERLDRMEAEARQAYTAAQQQINILETRQAELEQSLQNLVKLYSSLKPLIEGLNSIMQNN